MLRPVWPVLPLHGSYTCRGQCMVYTDRGFLTVTLNCNPNAKTNPNAIAAPNCN